MQVTLEQVFKAQRDIVYIDTVLEDYAKLVQEMKQHVVRFQLAEDKKSLAIVRKDLIDITNFQYQRLAEKQKLLRIVREYKGVH